MSFCIVFHRVIRLGRRANRARIPGTCPSADAVTRSRRPPFTVVGGACALPPGANAAPCRWGRTKAERLGWDLDA